MLIIPSLEVVFIQPPRTASESIALAAVTRYPETIYPYKHMELDGLPEKYRHYRKFGVWRHPAERLWSWYRKMREAKGSSGGVQDMEEFNRWLSYSTSMANNTKAVFREGVYYIPECRKSMSYFYTSEVIKDDIILYDHRRLSRLFADFDMSWERINNAAPPAPLVRTQEMDAHLVTHFSWDLSLDDGVWPKRISTYLKK